MAPEKSLQAPPAGRSVKQDMTPHRGEERQDTKTQLPVGGKQTRDGGRADDRSGSD
jgi:hypothetical protein